jgi:hypothetical protein
MLAITREIDTTKVEPAYTDILPVSPRVFVFSMGKFSPKF